MYGDTALHAAVWKGNPESVQIMVENGANIYERELQLAVKLKLKDILKLLIDYGTGKNKMSNQMALCEAVQKGYADMVELLINDKTDLNHKDAYGLTMLHHAALENHVSVAHILQSKGADPNVTNNKLDVPLHTASYYGYTSFARLL